MTAELDSLDFVRNELAAEVIRSFGELRLRVAGSSMLPAIWPDDILLIRVCGIGEAAPGDVVLFVRQRRLFAHRVVRRSGPCVVTRGDGNGVEDPAVHADELLGRVAGVWRRGKPVRAESGAAVARRLAAMILCRSATVRRTLLRLHALRRGAGS
jgi:signal peptidase